MMKTERVIVYIDGFNLYFGIRKYKVKWLDVEKLSQNMIKPTQTLIEVKYFTSRVSNDPPKEKRQRDYLSAIETTGAEIIYGHYKSRPKSCYRCGHSWMDNEEKMTDVNIAVHMLVDALENRFDKAILISGDSDLVPPINAIHSKFPGKDVIVAFPPNRHNISVKNASKASFIIGKSTLKKSQFPDSITLKGGFVLTKPTEWS